MNSTLKLVVYPAVAAFSLAAAFVAHAQTNNFELPVSQAGASSKSRAEVRAELLQARADGSLMAVDERYDPLAYIQAGVRAKAQPGQRPVLAQTPNPRVDTLSAAIVGEDSGSFFLSARTTQRDGSSVLAASGTRSVR